MRSVARVGTLLIVIVSCALVTDAQESRATTVPDTAPTTVRVLGRALAPSGLPLDRTEICATVIGSRRPKRVGQVTEAVATDGTFSLALREFEWRIAWVRRDAPGTRDLGSAQLDLRPERGGARTEVECVVGFDRSLHAIEVKDEGGHPIEGAVGGSAEIQWLPGLEFITNKRHAATDFESIPHLTTDDLGWGWPRSGTDFESDRLAVCAEGYRPAVVSALPAVAHVRLAKGVPVRWRFPPWFDPPARVGFLWATEVVTTLELDPTGEPEWWHHARVTIDRRLKIGTDWNDLVTTLAPGSYTASVRMVRNSWDDRMARASRMPAGLGSIDVPGTIVIPDSPTLLTIDLPVPEVQYANVVDMLHR